MSELSQLLMQRGHEVVQEGTEHDLLLPRGATGELLDAFKTLLYNLMGQDGFRKTLRDWAYNSELADSQHASYLRSYLSLCNRFGGWPDFTLEGGHEGGRRRYASSFEWYMSELLKRRFHARASGFGLRLRDANSDDEFDCVAVLDKGDVFIECKTGRDSLYASIERFVRRDAELGAYYSFFVFDRDYTFDRGVDEPQFTQSQATALGLEVPRKITVGSQSFFQLISRRGYRDNRWFLACGAFRGLESRIRYMIRYTNEFSLNNIASPLFQVNLIPFTADDIDLPSE